MKIIFVTIIIFILGLLDFWNPVRALFHKFSSPVQFGLRRSAIELKDTVKLFYNINNIRKENLRLLAENNQLKETNVELKYAQEENKILKNQINLKESAEFDRKLLLASVMGNNNDLSGSSILIDKGSRQGVEKGANAVYGQSIIGIVKEVTMDRSMVELTTSPNVSITVKKIDGSAEGLAIGDLGTSIRVIRLLPGDKVEPKEVFISSGKDGIFLPGFSIGYVADVTYESAEPLKTAFLTPMYDLSKLYKIFIIIEE